MSSCPRRGGGTGGRAGAAWRLSLRAVGERSLPWKQNDFHAAILPQDFHARIVGIDDDLVAADLVGTFFEDRFTREYNGAARLVEHRVLATRFLLPLGDPHVAIRSRRPQLLLVRHLRIVDRQNVALQV